MPYEEYVAQPFVQKHEHLKKIVDVLAAKKSGKYSGFSAVPSITGFSENKANLYLNSRGLELDTATD